MIIDVHGHITHPELFKRFPMPPALADIEGMLDRKAQAGIELTIVGSPVGFGTMMPVPGLDNYAQPLDRLKSFHDWLADTVATHRGRLAAYVYADPFGGDAMLEQTAATLRDGPFVGLIVNTSVKGRYLDADEAAPFFEMAAELDVPIFLHPPAEPVGSASLADFRLVEQVGRYVDVTVGVSALVFGGVLERHPGLRFIAATAGGATALLASRLDLAYAPRHYGPGGGPPGNGAAKPAAKPGAAVANKISEPPSTYLRRIYVDTANSSVPNHLANLEVMGADRILFGTDSPPLATPLEEAIGIVERLPVSAEDKRSILEGNARELFKLGG